MAEGAAETRAGTGASAGAGRMDGEGPGAGRTVGAGAGAGRMDGMGAGALTGAKRGTAACGNFIWVGRVFGVGLSSQIKV